MRIDRRNLFAIRVVRAVLNLYFVTVVREVGVIKCIGSLENALELRLVPFDSEVALAMAPDLA